MRGWRISINRAHVALWRRCLLGWIGFVGFALIAGAHLKPRMDEVLVVFFLPFWLVLLPYAIGCLALALVRLLWPARRWARAPVTRFDGLRRQSRS